jgi:hypothetical protein
LRRIFYICGLFVFVAACNKKQSGLPPLKETFYHTDANPFGASFAYDYTKSIFADEFDKSKKEFSDCYDLHYKSNSTYLTITPQFYPSSRDIEAIKSYIKNGNIFAVSANYFNDNFLEAFDSLQYQKNFDIDGLANSVASIKGDTDTLSEHFYYYYSNSGYLTYNNNAPHKKIGKNSFGKNNVLVLFIGKGRLIVHVEPRLFSNYFLLTADNHKYLNTFLGYLMADNRSLTWDTYYQRKTFNRDEENEKGFSTFSTFLKYPQTRNAFWLALALLLLFVLFGLKRRQRMVPIIKPTENSTVAFSEAIAGLYLSKKDNKVIADKTITFFNDYVRTKYLINANFQQPSYAELLSRKAEVDIETANQLSFLMRNVDRSITVTNEELLQLHSLIQKFNKG